MARFLGAARQCKVGGFGAIWDLLEDELGATFTRDANEKEATWRPRDIDHGFLLLDHGDRGLFLAYTAVVFEIDNGVRGLEVVSLLNRRQLGLTFVSIPIGDAGVIYAYSFAQISEDCWTNFALFTMLLKRQIGLVEVVSRQKWLREALGLTSDPQPLLEAHETAPLSLVLTPVLDPTDTAFAAGLWIAEAEGEEFHKYMKDQLPFVEAAMSYAHPWSDPTLDVSSEVRLEASYAHGSYRGMSQVRDYNALVNIQQMRHPELGQGVQETQTFAFFTRQEQLREDKGITGDAEASRLANVLNHMSYRNLFAVTAPDLPALAIGSWVAKRDQIFFGAFLPATVLKDLADECVGAFGFALALALSPRNAVQRADAFMAYLREKQLETQREPDPFADHWSGCNETSSGWPVIADVSLADEDHSRYGSDPATPVVTSIAAWGFFQDTPVIISLDLIQDPIASGFSLVERRRYPVDTESRLVHRSTVAVSKDDLDGVIATYFGSLQIPRIDWCQIQDRDYDECVRFGLRQFAHALSSTTDVEQIISEIYQAPSPWDLWAGVPFQNVFDSEKSVEAGLEWAVTLPSVVDSAIARLEMIFEHTKLRESGASDIELVRSKTMSEYFLRMRMGEIELFTPYEDFLREFFEADEETIQALLALHNPDGQ